jgi:heme/copper-type cytochrome/quinol oxidase subunit 3
MNVPVKFAGDLTELPSHAFGHRSLTWWGIVAFFVIEGTFFALTIAAYFYLSGSEGHWPPEPYRPPDLLAGTLFTLIILLSEIPNTIIKRAAEKKDLRAVQKWLLVMCGIGIVLLALRAFEFASLNVWWTDNAYGSIIWALLFLHTTHIATDLGDSFVLTALMFTGHAAEARRYVDVAENGMYWRFVWICWLPIYLLIYWLPRWMS